MVPEEMVPEEMVPEEMVLEEMVQEDRVQEDRVSLTRQARQARQEGGRVSLSRTHTQRWWLAGRPRSRLLLRRSLRAPANATIFPSRESKPSVHLHVNSKPSTPT
mmetsp:Transcript_14256/g.34524  ORF Transcript_14256/g.34524 Transcript_14256/m.34524 type:complete len:105 (-) Transcript_14256:382-696(-)